MTASRARPARRAVSRAAAVAAGAALALIAATVGLAASAAPSTVPANEPTVEAWIDTAIPGDAQVGAAWTFGLTMWDTTRQRFAQFNEAYVRLHPAKGEAAPAVAAASSDWPGHLVASIAIPEGGPGVLEVGVSDQTCVNGACSGEEFPFRIAGSGPPPNAERADLITATIHEIATPVVAKEALDVFVVIEPKATWDPLTLALPDHLVAVVNRNGGRDISASDLPATGQRGPGLPYNFSGAIAIPQPGDVTLTVAIPGNGTEDQFLTGTATRLTVVGGGPAGSAAPGSGAPDPAEDPGLPWLPIGALLLVVAGALVANKAFADL